MEKSNQDNDIEMINDQSLSKSESEENKGDNINKESSLSENISEKKNAHYIFDEASKKAIETRNKLGHYIYTKRPPPYLEWRDIYTEKDKFKYLGQWNPKTNTREGIGISVTNIGQINEGYRKKWIYWWNWKIYFWKRRLLWG